MPILFHSTDSDETDVRCSTTQLLTILEYVPRAKLIAILFRITSYPGAIPPGIYRCSL